MTINITFTNIENLSCEMYRNYFHVHTHTINIHNKYLWQMRYYPHEKKLEVLCIDEVNMSTLCYNIKTHNM